jgi:hypothetical protein
MDKKRLMIEAFEEIYEADDDGSEHPTMFQRHISIAIEQSWREGMTLDELVAAARAKLAGEGH